MGKIRIRIGRTGGQYPSPGTRRVAKAGHDAIFGAMNPDAQRGPDPWMDRFFETFFERRPVDATFIGVRGHDHRTPDVSPAGVEAMVSEVRLLLSEGSAAGGTRARQDDEPTGEGDGSRIEDQAGDPAERLARMDRRVAEGFLRIQLWELESGFRLSNPSVYAGEAIFGLLSLLLPGSAPARGRDEALAARMHAVGAYLDNARAHLVSAPPAWTERAIRECRGALTFLTEGLRHVDADLGDAPSAARAGFERYRRFLEDELLERPSDRVACGAEAFELHLRQGHFFDRSADEIAEYARGEIERTKTWLADAAADFGGGEPAEIVGRLADLHPGADGYLQRFEETWIAQKRLAEERDLVTWPDFPIRYVERPAWARGAAPDLYFLFYRSPAAFDRPAVHDYLVAPLPEDAAPEELEAFLRASNDSVIKLNHVVHHGGIGHHVQNWNAFRSPLRVGRVAAVDGAARIAMFCGGTMAEGWACYATDLMAEAGGLTPLEVYAEHYGRVRMAARAVVDVELHHGRMTLDDAARYYSDTAGMSAAAARSEAVKNSMFPGAALMYLVGTDMIHELRADLMGVLGDRFTLRGFHDAFLSYGSVPVKLVADEMRLRASLGQPLGAHDRPD